MPVTIKLNHKGIEEILRSHRVQADLERRARAIAAAAGAGHRVESAVGPHRARAAVITDTTEARRNQATRRTLSAAVDAGRG